MSKMASPMCSHFSHSCQHCTKSFSYIGHMKRHERIHTEKPYSCKICKKRFRQKNNMKRHEKIHIKKPYSCKICKKSFRQKCNLLLIQIYIICLLNSSYKYLGKKYCWVQFHGFYTIYIDQGRRKVKKKWVGTSLYNVVGINWLK